MTERVLMGYTWQYYDLLLAAIGASVLAGVGVGVGSAVPMNTAVVGACLVAAALVGYGLFVNGPVDRPADLSDPVESLN